MKKFFMLTLLLLLLLPVVCEAATAKKIAILPVFSRSYYDDEIEKQTARDFLYNKFQAPDNADAWEVIPEQTVLSVIPPNLQGGKKRGKLPKDLLPAVADKLAADWVIAAEITELSENSSTSSYTGTSISARLAIRVLAYDRATNTFYEKSDFEVYDGGTDNFDEQYLTTQIMTHVLNRLPIGN